MGVFTYPVGLALALDGPFETIEAVVETGAIYTQVPGSMLRRLGVQPFDRAQFQLADGRKLESELGEVFARIDGRFRRTICVFGEEGTPEILGAYTLEAFLLSADPVNKRLVPVVGLRLRRSSPAPLGRRDSSRMDPNGMRRSLMG